VIILFGLSGSKRSFMDEAMNQGNCRIVLNIVLVAAAMGLLNGCAHHAPKYGTEAQLVLPGVHRQTWAVAPAVNLSGETVDPLLQADLLFGQLQQVKGLTVIPVNRVAEVYASLRINQVQSDEQASIVCDLLGCDALVVPTVTLYDPYNPPKFGASLQLFGKPASYARTASVDPRELARQAAPEMIESLPPTGKFLQSVGMFDASAGSTRDALWLYASGRNDPIGPLGSKEYLVSMDRYCGFAYWSLTRDLLGRVKPR
jgi:hypothetical protein